jgi:hypothetical protein
MASHVDSNIKREATKALDVLHFNQQKSMSIADDILGTLEQLEFLSAADSFVQRLKNPTTDPSVLLTMLLDTIKDSKKPWQLRFACIQGVGRSDASVHQIAAVLLEVIQMREEQSIGDDQERRKYIHLRVKAADSLIQLNCTDQDTMGILKALGENETNPSVKRAIVFTVLMLLGNKATDLISAAIAHQPLSLDGKYQKFLSYCKHKYQIED